MTALDTLTAAAVAIGKPLGFPYNLQWRAEQWGIDCSGFVSQLAIYFGASGISATDWTGSLFPKTQPVSGPPKIGDVVFFGDPNAISSHVAIWAGGDTIFQASQSAGGVSVGSLSAMTKYYGNAVFREIPALTNALDPTSSGGSNSGGSSGSTSGGSGGGSVPSSSGSGQSTELGTLLVIGAAFLLLVVGALAWKGKEVARSTPVVVGV